MKKHSVNRRLSLAGRDLGECRIILIGTATIAPLKLEDEREILSLLSLAGNDDLEDGGNTLLVLLAQCPGLSNSGLRTFQ